MKYCSLYKTIFAQNKRTTPQKKIPVASLLEFSPPQKIMIQKAKVWRVSRSSKYVNLPSQAKNYPKRRTFPKISPVKPSKSSTKHAYFAELSPPTSGLYAPIRSMKTVSWEVLRYPAVGFASQKIFARAIDIYLYMKIRSGIWETVGDILNKETLLGREPEYISFFEFEGLAFDRL